MTSPAPGMAPLRVALVVEQLWQQVPGGSGTYIVALARALQARADVAVTGIAARHRRAVPELGTLLVDHSKLHRRALYGLWNAVGRPRAETLAAAPVDVVHATTWAVPGTRRPLVVTVHDLAFMHDPGHFTKRGADYFRRSLVRVHAEAAAVVVPSEATRIDCLEQGFDQARLYVVPHGVEVPRIAAADVATFRERHALIRPYILWTGTREPRKNLPRLVEAFRLLRDSGADVDLVLVGPVGWGDQIAHAPDGVRVLGRLAEQDLHRAYAGAEVFCFPSLREGFGLPVLEAMAHGVPVVTSAGTSTAEIVGGPSAGVLVDPEDPAAIAAGLASALEHRNVLAAGAARRANRYSWVRAATDTLEVYRRAAG